MKRQGALAAVTRKNIKAVSTMETASARSRSRGDRFSDLIAGSIGSWPLILGQCAVIVLWMALNVIGRIRHWDPYPFTFLNLALSIQAAFAGPIIMMSQNRQMALTERRHQLDLQINLLAEQEETEVLRLLRLLCEQAGVPRSDLARGKAFAERTQIQELISQLDGKRPKR
ncbi:MAG TPA: DUF1003 domain-containing protein [Candidatus Limnocylindria bacterium]|nr:DUF1003 domain-containing protein [Candidatus Limnocylindria bacterium]